MDFTQLSPEIIYGLLFLVNFILSLCGLRKNKTMTITDVVNKDLDDLIAYHEKTLASLKALKK